MFAQAITLSLGGLTEGSTAACEGVPSNSGLEVVDSGPSRKKDKAKMQKSPETRKKHNVVSQHAYALGSIFYVSDLLNNSVHVQVKSRVQLTEDEVIAYFFSFDGRYSSIIPSSRTSFTLKFSKHLYTDLHFWVVIHYHPKDLASWLKNWQK